MSKKTFEQPNLEEYPLKDSKNFRVLEAETIYRFRNKRGNEETGRWLAVVGVETTFYDRRARENRTSRKVMVYRWIWRRGNKFNPSTRKWEKTGSYKWFKEQEMSFTSREAFEKVVNAVAKMWDAVEED